MKKHCEFYVEDKASKQRKRKTFGWGKKKIIKESMAYLRWDPESGVNGVCDRILVRAGHYQWQKENHIHLSVFLSLPLPWTCSPEKASDPHAKVSMREWMCMCYSYKFSYNHFIISDKCILCF